MRDALREVFEAISRHRLRALATSFGVFWGIFMLTLLLGGGNGLRSGLLGLFEGIKNLTWIEAGRTSAPYQGLGAGRQIDLDLHDVQAMQSMRELRSVSPRQPLPPHFTLSRGSRTFGLPVLGVNEQYADIERLKLLRGRLLNALDLSRTRKVLVIGTRARTVMFGEENPIGQRVYIGGTSMTIVGEFSSASGDEDNRQVLAPYTTALQTFDSSPKIQYILANTSGRADEATVRSRLLHLIARRHRFDPTDNAALDLWFASEEFKRLNKLMRGIDVAIIAVGLGTLLSGMVGVSNILFVSVRERAKEFGIRRALGATARSILAMVISEALLLASMAGVLGLLAALVLLAVFDNLGIDSEYFKQPQVDLNAALWALGTLVCTALIAGYFPAREAARMTPIEALRRE